jgi:hypothetical protein
MEKNFYGKIRLILTMIICISFIQVAFFSAMGNFSSNQDYKLLIIAPDEFIDELQSLQVFKNLTDRPTILLSLTKVYIDFENSVWDEAEKVKRCIAHYEQSYGIDYVMLIGDIDRFPARFTWWGLPGQENWVATDHYYADLYKQGTTIFDDWNSNGNDLYGEIEFTPDGYINNDNIDYLPDVAIGRIPVSEEEEVTAYVNKVMDYEWNSNPSQSWFKTAALYTGNWGGKAYTNDIKDFIGNLLINKGFNLIKRYYDWENSQWPPGLPNVVVEDLNNGVGFVNYIGHGNIWGFHQIIGVHQLKLLNNAKKLPIVFGVACDTGFFAPMCPFRPYIDVNGGEHYGSNNGEVFDVGDYPHPNLPRPAPLQDDDDGGVWYNGNFYPFDNWCVAEYWISGHPDGNPGTGAVAYLGARSGGQATGIDLDQFFFEGYCQGYTVLGDIWKYMMEEYYDYYNIQDSNNWLYPPGGWPIGHRFAEPQKYILFGDSSLEVGGLTGLLQLSVSVDFDSNILNLKSKGKWVTCYIELPEGYDVNDIDVSAIMLNLAILAEEHPTEIGDYDYDGIPDLMVKFDRQKIQGILSPGDDVMISVLGRLFDGTLFEGIDLIKVI